MNTSIRTALPIYWSLCLPKGHSTSLAQANAMVWIWRNSLPRRKWKWLVLSHPASTLGRKGLLWTGSLGLPAPRSTAHWQHVNWWAWAQSYTWNRIFHLKENKLWSHVWQMAQSVMMSSNCVHTTSTPACFMGTERYTSYLSAWPAPWCASTSVVITKAELCRWCSWEIRCPDVTQLSLAGREDWSAQVIAE